MYRSVTALATAGLLAACGGGGLAASMEVSGTAMAPAKPTATIRATYAVRASGKVVVRLASNAKVANVRYRRNGATRTFREQLSRGRGRVVLRRGASSIRARAKATRTLARSRWVSATKVIPRDPKPDPGGSIDSVGESLALAARQRVFFGHQSVGRNILDGIPTVYGSHDIVAPPILSAEAAPDTKGGYVLEAEIGENTEPLRKISDFDARLRGGIANRVDVAVMKFCYVDVQEGADVQAIFAAYRSAMAALSADYPDLALVHVTTPLTTDEGADNVARERLNQLIRDEYGGTGRLFDLAKVESTRPDGTEVQGAIGGERYFALHEGYAADSGHLNEVGSERAAAELLLVIASAARG